MALPVLLSLFAGAALAHEVRPAYLELVELDPQTWDVLWKVPARDGRSLGLGVEFPAHCRSTAPHGRFTEGAYIAVALIVSLVLVFHKVHQHYTELGRQLRIERIEQPKPIRSTAIVLTTGIHKGIQLALEYARTLSPDCWALYVETDPTETPAIRDRWESCGQGYRS